MSFFAKYALIPASLMILATLSWIAAPTSARAEGPRGDEAPARVLKGKDITEDAVADALFPIRTRSLRPLEGRPAPSAKAQLLITFVTGSANLTDDARSQLDAVARAMKRGDQSIGFTIEGHADPRGTVEGNLALSKARAQSVTSYLAQNHGLDVSRMVAVGKGSSELLNPAEPTAEENRRVTIVVNNKSDSH